MGSSRWSRRGGLVLCVTAVGYAVACGGESSNSQPAATPAATPAPATAPVAENGAAAPAAAPAASATPPAAAAEAPPVNPALTAEEQEGTAELAQHHRHHHGGGILRFIALSIDTLGAEGEQKAKLEKIQTDLEAKLEGSKGKSRAVVLAVADEVAKGSTPASVKSVDAAIGELAKASAAAHTASMDALTKLHDALKPEQRKALVDKVEAHWAVWRAVNTDAEAKDDSHPAHGHLAHLAAKLNLSADTVDKIREAEKTALGDVHKQINAKEVEDHLTAFSTAFEADKFDPSAIKDGPGAHMSTWGATRMARYYEAMIPVLDKDQRKALAEMIRDHVNAKAKK